MTNPETFVKATERLIAAHCNLLLASATAVGLGTAPDYPALMGEQEAAQIAYTQTLENLLAANPTAAPAPAQDDIAAFRRGMEHALSLVLDYLNSTEGVAYPGNMRPVFDVIDALRKVPKQTVINSRQATLLTVTQVIARLQYEALGAGRAGKYAEAAEADQKLQGAALALDALKVEAGLYRHNKSGKLYRLLAEAEDQASSQFLPLAIYQSIETSKLYARSITQFYERFTVEAAAQGGEQ